MACGSDQKMIKRTQDQCEQLKNQYTRQHRIAKQLAAAKCIEKMGPVTIHSRPAHTAKGAELAVIDRTCESSN